MANRRNIRAHTRSTPSGGQTRVGDYRQRRQPGAQPSKPLVSPRHALQLLQRAGRAGRRKKRGLAVFLFGLAGLELGAWVGLNGASFILATGGILMLATAAGGFSVTGMFK